MTVSLTKFIDFVNSTGPSKMRVVENYLTGPSYDIRRDFYKKFRDSVVKMHKIELNIEYLEQVFNELTDDKKIPHYAQLNKGYKKFCKKKKLSWFDPPNTICDATGLEIGINPELGLEIDGTPYIIKMYMKDAKLTQGNVDMIITLMEIALNEEIPDNAVIAMLDVRKGRIRRISKKSNLKMITLQLESESDYWKKVAAGI